jgi:hypothetical protein
MAAIDYMRDVDNDIAIVNGDFAIGLSDEQHIADILQAYPGDFKQFPLVGVNINKAINGAVDGELRKEIRLQLVADGYNVTGIDFINDQLLINAKRNS